MYKINGKNILFLEARGCNSDNELNNYRVCTLSENIPGKDGNSYFLEFTPYNARKVLHSSPKTGKPYKHYKVVTAMEDALHIDTCYTDAEGLSWRNSKLEETIHATPAPFGRAAILDTVNSIATEHYDDIKIAIVLPVVRDLGKDFTANTCILQYIKEHPKTEYSYNPYGEIIIHTYTGNYKYCAWNIDEASSTVNIIMEKCA